MLTSYFSVGVEFENSWLPKFKAQNRNLNIIDISKGVERIGGNPHIWLSPKSLKVMAENVSRALIDLWWNQSGSYRANLKDYYEKLDYLDWEIKEVLKGCKRERHFLRFLTTHSWGTYFWPGDFINFKFQFGQLEDWIGQRFSQKAKEDFISRGSFKLKAQKQHIGGLRLAHLFYPKEREVFSTGIRIVGPQDFIWANWQFHIILDLLG